MDQLDRKLIKALQDNGRASNAELSRIFGVAPSTLLERLRRLEERGVFKGYRAIVNPEAVGLMVQGFVFVTLDRHDVNCIEKFEEGIRHLPFIRACYHVTGRFDYLLHVAAKDLTDLGNLVKQQIAGITGIGKAETFLILSEVKPEVGWMIDDSE